MNSNGITKRGPFLDLSDDCDGGSSPTIKTGNVDPTNEQAANGNRNVKGKEIERTRGTDESESSHEQDIGANVCHSEANLPQAQKRQEALTAYFASIERLNKARPNEELTEFALRIKFQDAYVDPIREVCEMATNLENLIAEFRDDRKTQKENRTPRQKRIDKLRSGVPAVSRPLKSAAALANDVAQVHEQSE